MEVSAQVPIRWEVALQKSWPDWLPRARDEVWKQCQTIANGECCMELMAFRVTSLVDPTWTSRCCAKHQFIYLNLHTYRIVPERVYF